MGFNVLLVAIGGALGSVAVQELTALQAVLGSLDVWQSNAQLKNNLNKIKNILTKWENAKTGKNIQQQTPTSGLTYEDYLKTVQ